MDVNAERELERFELKNGQELEHSAVFLSKAKWYVDYNGERKFTYLGWGDISKQNLEKIKEKIGIVGMFLITGSGGEITKTKEGIKIDHLKYIVTKDVIYYVLDREYNKEVFAMIEKGYFNREKNVIVIGNERLTVYRIEQNGLRSIALTSYEQALRVIMGF